MALKIQVFLKLGMAHEPVGGKREGVYLVDTPLAC
jgi:hypothetical protein